ncbi:hypothetical protein OJAV_G00122990 [Oryzias javanicus]|uniref:Uncharacterized protein n=1 Tax=Oryzias javanicus TaxID=123683 RepID=A0A3S2P717_ORYJA|nr:hypothetical protein OJAV_G00122990 [Oryzias javanicus]
MRWSSPVWVSAARPPVADKHFTEPHQSENRGAERGNRVGDASKADSPHCFHMLQHPSAVQTSISSHLSAILFDAPEKEQMTERAAFLSGEGFGDPQAVSRA